MALYNKKSLTEDDFENLKKLCAMHCTAREAASFFDIARDTLTVIIKERYGVGWEEFHEAHSGKGKVSLRRKQFDMAMSGNITMLVWLGKQYLGQKDRVEHTGDGQPIPVKVILPDNGRSYSTTAGSADEVS